MIRKKIVALAVLSVLALGITSEAYDIKKIADERWPSMFTYTEIEGGHTISDPEGKLSYQLGQISLQPPGTKNMICGYLVTAELPPHKEESLRPYFREYLTIHEWRGLVKLNRLLLGSDSPLRSKIETLIRNGEVLFPEGLRSSAKISLEEIEPYHRLSFTESYLYVAASRIIFDMGGMKFPFYGRAYFFRHDDHMDMMLLVMPDETKEPVIYVTDDLAKTVAKEIYTDREGKEDLAVMLGKYLPACPVLYEKADSDI